MYVSPQAIVYQASEHEPLLQRWHEGLELNMRPVAEQLNFIELMFIHSAHARILASPSTNYHLSLEGHSLRWINYVHNTGSRRYADKPDHEAFQLRRENNSWLAQKDTISIQEIILLNPYSADSLSQRLRFDVHALNSVHAQAKQLAKVYIPGPEAEMYLPIEHQFTNKPRKKKKELQENVLPRTPHK